MSAASIPLPSAVAALAQQEAQRLLDEILEVQAVVVASVDGFDVASAIRSNMDAGRIAAMASSIAAISSVVSHEAQLGRSRSVTIDTESGFAVVRSVYRTDVELIINVIANEGVLIGEVAYRTTQFARQLAEA
ncbi:hypothetical protein E9531_03680 [Lampropedia puyangensis]|uniref:Roadblock/LAMTOR2 domain-containing protein n=1 Tax=Lampropedia puyangensis TaxID=1330072 RepID=A0A4S8FAG8_9BURK|nr:roadblock/LC7 domain-containing protein [Lampropedia puyangensis]THU04500.1 hypothetical protein E9531_03680 [Lampropedia puyangensis]